MNNLINELINFISNEIPNDEPDDNFNQNDIYFQLNQELIHNVISMRQNLTNTNNNIRIQNARRPPFQNTTIINGINYPHNRNLRPTFTGTDMIDNILSIMESVLTSHDDFSNLENVKITLPETEFNKLNCIVPNELLHNDNNNCNICLDKMIHDSELVILDCKHIYHKSCLKEWLTKESTKCPSCRFDVRKNHTTDPTDPIV